MELSRTKIQISESVVVKTKITEAIIELQMVKKENMELKQVLENRDSELNNLIEEKERQIQSYQYSHSILEVKINQLEENLVAIKQEKQVLEEKLTYNSNHEINSLKLISKIKEQPEPEDEDRGKAKQLEKILEDKQQ